MKKNKSISMFLVAVMLLCTFYTGQVNAAPNKSKPVSESQTDENTPKLLEPYKNLLYNNKSSMKIKKQVYEESEYNKDDIFTYTFNEETIFKGSEDLKEKIMENGKNPGLGIRSIHKQGITGKGVNVAIIDQNLLLNHPEFAGKITSYYDTGCGTDKEEGSMHAPAVTSILVGNNIGVAPDAKVYFAAVPSWFLDSSYYAKGLDWIIEENKKLPVDEKIRVVSVSAAPSGDASLFKKNLEMWDDAVLEAQKEGILVLDCRDDDKTGIIYPAFYDPTNPKDISLCTGGFPPSMIYKIPSSKIGVPTSYRTVAEEYTEGSPSYQYTGEGGLSWGIPYGAGVLALGWQINPDLDNDKIIQMLLDTCSVANDGSNIINPTEFIEAVKNTVSD